MSQNPDSDEQWSKEHQADLPGMSFYFAKNGGTENIKASDLVLSYVRDDGSLETEGIGVLQENEQNEEITDASFTKTGTYQVALKEKVDADTEPVTIHDWVLYNIGAGRRRYCDRRISVWWHTGSRRNRQ